MMEPESSTDLNLLQENFEDFFEETLCGFIITDTRGVIVKANKKVAGWVGRSADELKGVRFSDLLAIGGKIYYETHLGPLLRLQGFFDEVVLELNNSIGHKMRVMINAMERRNEKNQPCFLRFTILKASDRLKYEKNLQETIKVVDEELEKQKEMVMLREQLIAVLGHDLRNPLSSIAMAVAILNSSSPSEHALLVSMINQSCNRMKEIVNNIMDFARTRLGEGIVLTLQDTLLQPVLLQVVNELIIANPEREITTSFQIARPINCDPHRIAQLLSNLLANALTHGDADSPVNINAFDNNGNFELSVSNKGNTIPADMHEQLFTPFTREISQPSRHGLGLGLYICSEIAKAHHATLSFTSAAQITCFTFRMAT